MANTQSGSSRGVESHSHDSVTLRSGRHIQYESPVVRRQVTPSLERNHEEDYWISRNLWFGKIVYLYNFSFYEDIVFKEQ